jgi:hypothetical protein
MKAEARAKVNAEAGTRRMMARAIFTPGRPGWLDQVDRVIAELKPDSFKGYTIGDNTHKDLSKYPWHLDDEKLVYPFYERCAKADLVNICIHKGLFAPSTAEKFPHLLAHADVRAQFEQTGRVEWVSDLADIPERYGVTNVYGDLGQIFAQSTMAFRAGCRS